MLQLLFDEIRLLHHGLGRVAVGAVLVGLFHLLKQRLGVFRGFRHENSGQRAGTFFVISGPKWEDPWKQLLGPKTQKRDETPSSKNETPSSPDRPTTRRLLIAATTRLRPPDVRSANESSVVQVGSSTNAATSCL